MRFVSYMRRSAKILILNNIEKGSSKKFPMSAAPMSR